MRFDKIEQYLQEVLGLSSKVKPWVEAANLPYFLQDAFEFAAIELLGMTRVLMSSRDQEFGASKIRKHLDTLLASTGICGIYVAAAMTSSERKRLIGQQVPFIVPGNQLYLPDLGIDLREYFRQCRQGNVDKGLSPATQALLIRSLTTTPWKAEVSPAELGEGMGYTVMTLSRAVKELEQREIVTVIAGGRARRLHFGGDARTLWRKALPFLRSPVMKRISAFPTTALMDHARLAGESALSSLTMLAEPAQPVYAIDAEHWKRAQEQGMTELPWPEIGSCQWQIWRYSPSIIPEGTSVDPYSLVLSLQEEKDERVQQALSEFEELLPW